MVKIVKPKVNGVVDKQSNWIYTYYSYDANGQVMAVYDCKLDATNTTLNKATLKEQHLYGSQRLGMVNKNTLLYQSNTAYTAISPLVQNTYGNTNYELNNHLGNVNAVITDRRFWNTTTLKYEADVEMKNDYYPFGMAMKGRQLTPDYRFGYNGMELDNEVSGNGNSYTTEFRQYDPRLGRWKSLDPLMAQYPSMSPYNYAGNSPILLVDRDGQEIFIFYDSGKKNENGTPIYTYYNYGSGLKLPNDKFVRQTVRTLNKIKRRGYDPMGIIDYAKNSDKKYAIMQSSHWYKSGGALSIEIGEMQRIGENEGFEPAKNEIDFIISWHQRSGYISPDGKINKVLLMDFFMN